MSNQDQTASTEQGNLLVRFLSEEQDPKVVENVGFNLILRGVKKP